MIVEAALDAGDAIDAALSTPTKTETVYYGRRFLALLLRGESMGSFTVSASVTFTATRAASSF